MPNDGVVPHWKYTDVVAVINVRWTVPVSFSDVDESGVADTLDTVGAGAFQRGDIDVAAATGKTQGDENPPPQLRAHCAKPVHVQPS
jgi:hypothetical protein